MYIVNHHFHQMENLIVILNIKYTPSEIAIKETAVLSINAYLGNTVISWLPKIKKYNM